MTSPVLVTGGTGRLGRHVVWRFHDTRCQVRVLSRRSRDQPLPAPGHGVGRRTWEQFLTASLQAGAPGAAQAG